MSFKDDVMLGLENGHIKEKVKFLPECQGDLQGEKSKTYFVLPDMGNPLQDRVYITPVNRKEGEETFRYSYSKSLSYSPVTKKDINSYRQMHYPLRRNK